ncbi:TonB-dependent siderophore receptor [Acidomonas methanolica]|uniref:TonB-dependent siderophore receptor n=1 Tax=Acidomonas methanolica TaxID=437 RepID=UPI00211A8F7C|nr:TonB-dependent siderophore receptor [Acidomonas methanolica]
MDRSMEFHVSGGDLDHALTQAADQSGVHIFFPSAAVAGKKSAGLSGTLTVSQALARLLGGSGLSWRLQDGKTVLVSTRSAITLGPVRVGGAVAHQDPTGPAVGYVAENTMAGTKTDTPLMEIPNSIYVVTKQQMIDQQPQNINEALRYSPGVFAEPNGTFGKGDAMNGTGIKQRGFNTTQYVDGLRDTSYAAGETTFLERIEAVNGPASVMYGQNAPGGLVTMSLKKPTETPLHQATLGFGNWNRFEATFDVSDKVTQSGNLRYRIAAIGNTQAEQADYHHYRRVAVLPSLTWNIDPNTALTLIGSYNYTPYNGANAGAQYTPNGTLIVTDTYPRIPRHTFAGLTNFNQHSVQDAMFEYQFTHRFNQYINFSQVLRWEKSVQKDKDSYSGGGALTPDPRLQYYLPEIRNYSSNGVSFDTRLHGTVNTGPIRHIWVVGSDFRRYDNPQNNTIACSILNCSFATYFINLYHPQSVHYDPCMSTAPSSGCHVTGYNGAWDYFQEGVYFQDQMKWKSLSVILGGREDWFNQSSHTYGFGTGKNHRASASQNAFTWRAGIVYQFDFGLAPYFSYSKSFNPQTATDFYGKLFQPLTGNQIEAGLKYKVPGKDILLTAAAYRIDENHYLISDFEHPGFSRDAGVVRSQGFEVAANANVTRDLRVIASYSFSDLRYRKNNLSERAFNPYTWTFGPLTAEEGKSVPGAPRNMVSLFADYTLPAALMKGFGINWGLRYVGFTYATDVDSYKVPAFILFDIGAHYDFGQATPMLHGLVARLAVSNLTNSYYVSSCGNYNCYVGQGRKVYGNLTYNW